MKNSMVTLALGVPEEGPRIILNSTTQSITLAVGPPGVGPCIVIGVEAIVIKCAESVWALDPEGIESEVMSKEDTIDLNAVLEALTLEESVDASVSRESSISMEE